MNRYVALAARPLASLVAVVLLVTLATSAFLNLIPGTPADVIAGSQATPAQVRVVTHQLHLDRPFIVQYADWLRAAIGGNLGHSYATQQSVVSELAQRFPITLEIALLALLIALIIALPVGVWSAYRADKTFDRVATVGASGMLAIPTFVIALLLVYLLAVSAKTLPVSGWVPLSASVGQNLEHAILPTLALGLPLAALFARLLRNDMVATLQEDYVNAARARGLPTTRILIRHALRPSSFSLLTVMGVAVGQLIGGTIIVETVFVLPGIGQLAINSINNRDYVSLRGIVLIFSVAYVVLNALVDLSYPLLDPRVRGRRS